MITVFTRTRLLILLFSFIGLPAMAQQSILDAYIKQAIDSNIVIKQKNVSLEKAKIALDMAKSYYYPTVAFQMGYQTASGGRDIQLPLGDLLNGVYSTLNSLTSGNNFPVLKNEQINFLPSNFYDAKIRTTVPIINPELKYNRQLAAQQIVLSNFDLDIYKRDLVYNTKEAYYNYLLSLEAVRIYEQSLALASEGKRANQKLLDNGKGLPAYVIRSESEVESTQAELNNARSEVRNAQLYFNFLLNRPLDAPIDSGYDANGKLGEVMQLLSQEINASQREEIKQLQEVSRINETVIRLNKTAFYPKLNGFIDLGSQAEDFKFNGQSRYFMFGLQLDIPIFSGFRNRNKIRQSGLDMKNTALSLAIAEQQFSLAGNVSKNNLSMALQTLKAKQKQMETAATYHRLIERGYREGVNTFIETIDARTQLTQAKISCTIQEYNVLKAVAALERALASDNINQ